MTPSRRIVLTFLAVAGCASASPRPESSHETIGTPVFAAARSSSVVTPATATDDWPLPQPPTTPVGNMSGGKEHAMANCPCAVPGARTTMIFTDDGIELLITAPTPAAQKTIRDLAHRHALLSAPSGRGLHTGSHGGPGRTGYCPIIHDDHTIVTATDAPAGARIRMRTSGDGAIADLQELVALRVSGLPPVVPPTQPAQPAAK